MPSVKHSGFTLIEILVVLAVLLIVAIIVIAPFNQFRQARSLDDGAELVMTAVRTARSDTLSAKDDQQYGVWFGSDRVAVFAGDQYQAGQIKQEVKLPAEIIISQIDLADGGDWLVFARLTGEPSTTGTLTLTGSSDSSRQIEILAGGIIDIKGHE